VSAVGPRRQGQQGWAALLDGGQHLVPAQDVEGFLPVHLHGDVGWGRCHAGMEGVPDNLAAPADAYRDLQWGEGAAGLRTGGQGEESGKPVPHFADCDGPDAAGWLGEGKEACTEEAGKVGKVAADRCLDESEHGGTGVFAAAGGGLDVLVIIYHHVYYIICIK
jgi:uncharacterized protein with LGFP repeats